MPDGAWSESRKSGIMSKRSEIEETVERLLAPIAEAHGVRIYDVEYSKDGGENALCAYIDKDGGVTIDDCVDVSHDLSDVLDREDPITEAYTLYVSSPGLGRTLTKDRHFLASIGEEVEGTTFKPFLTPEEQRKTAAEGTENAAGQPDGGAANPGKQKKSAGGKKPAGSRNFDGVLKAYDADAGTVTIGRTDAKGRELEDLVLNRKDIAKIRLQIDF